MNEGIDKHGLERRKSADGRVTLWALPSLLPAALAAGLLEELPLDRLAGAQATAFRGRGAPSRLILDGRFVVAKELRRGGLAGRFRGARFSDSTRLEALLAAQLQLEAARVSVAPFAFARARRVDGGVILDFATFELRDARDAATLLPTVATAVERCALVAAAAGVVRALHAAGCVHADLNAKNVLLERSPPRAWLLDFDKSRCASEGVAFKAAVGNLARLLRSVEKLGLLGRSLKARELAGFVRAYAIAARREAPPTVWRRHALWRAVAACRARSIFWHRLGWRVFGRGR